MALRELVISLDSSILDIADTLFDEMGIDTEIAIKVFLKRVINDRRMPFELVAPATEIVPPTPDPFGALTNHPSYGATTQSGKITRDMCLKVWEAFKQYYMNREGSLQVVARFISKETGMNTGSAFIYLNIINNLVNGSLNKRILKFDDLLFFLEKIKVEFPEPAYQSAIISLNKSIPYWEEKVPGAFSDNVSKLIDCL